MINALVDAECQYLLHCEIFLYFMHDHSQSLSLRFHTVGNLHYRCLNKDGWITPLFTVLQTIATAFSPLTAACRKVKYHELVAPRVKQCSHQVYKAVFRTFDVWMDTQILLEHRKKVVFYKNGCALTFLPLPINTEGNITCFMASCSKKLQWHHSWACGKGILKYYCTRTTQFGFQVKLLPMHEQMLCIQCHSATWVNMGMHPYLSLLLS